MAVSRSFDLSITNYLIGFVGLSEIMNMSAWSTEGIRTVVSLFLKTGKIWKLNIIQALLLVVLGPGVLIIT